MKSRNLKIWLVVILAILFILGSVLFVIIDTGQELTKQSVTLNQSRADLLADALNEKVLGLQGEMIALAEQRGVREGMRKWVSGNFTRDWEAGFLSTSDAACLAIVARGGGVVDLAIRDLKGEHLAGSGQGALPITLPEPSTPIGIKWQTLTQSPDLIELWTIPIRNTQAQPVAILTSRVDFGIILNTLTASQVKNDTTSTWVCVNGAWKLLWKSKSDLTLPESLKDIKLFENKGKLFTVASSRIPCRDWHLLYIDSELSSQSTSSAFHRKAGVLVGIEIILLILVGILFVRSKKPIQDQ
jgi:hypothetical protein